MGAWQHDMLDIPAPDFRTRKPIGDHDVRASRPLRPNAVVATGRRRIVTRFRWIPRAGSEHLEIVDAVGAGDLFGDADEDVLRHPVVRPFRHVELG